MIRIQLGTTVRGECRKGLTLTVSIFLPSARSVLTVITTGVLSIFCNERPSTG